MSLGRPQEYKKPDLIVMDLDGTLTDISDKAARLSSVSDKLHVPFSQAAYWTLKTVNNIYKNIGIQSRFVEAAREDILDILCAEKNDMFMVLQTAFGKDIPCSLLSNGPRQWGEKILRRLQISGYFDQTMFREDVAHLKPAPDALLNLLADKAVGQDSTAWVCGDRTADVYLAMNANAASLCNVIPVAINGTKAADTIIGLRDKFDIMGHVFDTPHDIACAIDPDLEYRITKVANRMDPAQHHLASFRLQ